MAAKLDLQRLRQRTVRGCLQSDVLVGWCQGRWTTMRQGRTTSAPKTTPPRQWVQQPPRRSASQRHVCSKARHGHELRCHWRLFLRICSQPPPSRAPHLRQPQQELRTLGNCLPVGYQVIRLRHRSRVDPPTLTLADLRAIAPVMGKVLVLAPAPVLSLCHHWRRQLEVPTIQRATTGALQLSSAAQAKQARRRIILMSIANVC